MDILETINKVTPMLTDLQLEEHPEYYEWHDTMMELLETQMKPTLIRPVLKTFGYGYANEGYFSVVYLLETQPAEELHKALRDSLVKGHDGERMWAAYMLGRYEDPDDIHMLLTQLAEPKELARREVVTALSRFDDPRVLPALLNLQTNEKSEAVQSSLKYGLKRLTGIE